MIEISRLGFLGDEFDLNWLRSCTHCIYDGRNVCSRSLIAISIILVVALSFNSDPKVFEMEDGLFIKKELSGFVYMWVLLGRFIDWLLTISTTHQPFVAER